MNGLAQVLDQWRALLVRDKGTWQMVLEVS
jgi:hypothetical protein